MEAPSLTASPTSLAHRVRYALTQLRARNGHHTFEDICREFSRERISRNILPATGPVGSGGDQGRDFETFRCFIRDAVDYGFGAIEPVGRIAFACTLQQERLAEKIRNDVTSIMKGNSVAIVYSFCEANLTTSRRHELQQWAKDVHQVELEIIDGNGLAELLAVRELFWIAVTYLHLPASLTPIEPEYLRPRQLPMSTSDFTARTRELSELSALCGHGLKTGRQEVIDCHQVVVVSGPAGVGKSALIARLAHDLSHKYIDGQLYCNLRGIDQKPKDPSVILRQFLRALGMEPANIPDDTDELAGAYRSLLADRRALVLLDNAANETQVRYLLPGGHDCLVLVTSRNTLPALEGAKPYQLGVLEPDESLLLLATIAGEDKLIDAPGCRELVRYCGGLPLAIRITAGRLRARADWTATHLAQRLADSRRRLDQLHLGDLDVRASFELSERELDPDSRKLFRRLSVIPGPTFSTDLAIALLDTSYENADDALDKLIRDQLVAPTATPDYYQIHDLLKVFASERLRDADETYEENVTIVSDWYARSLASVAPHVMSIQGNAWSAGLSKFTESSADEQSNALAWMDIEAENLNSILHVCRDLGFYKYTAISALPIAEHAHVRGLWAEWSDSVDIGLNAARRLDDRPRQARYLFELGELYASRGDFIKAIKYWTDAAKLTENASLPGFRGTIHNRLAHTYLYQGRLADADREISAAKEDFDAIDSTLANVAYANFRSELLLNSNKPREASDLLELRILPIIDQLGPQTQVEVRVKLASAYKAQQRHPEALRQLAQCRDICRDRGLRAITPTVLLLLGEAYQRLDIVSRAQKAWEDGLELAQRDAYPEAAGHLASALGTTALRAGDLARAREMFEQAIDLFRITGLTYQQANALHGLATTHWYSTNVSKAESTWAQAFEVLEHASDPKQARQTRKAIEKARWKITASK